MKLRDIFQGLTLNPQDKQQIELKTTQTLKSLGSVTPSRRELGVTAKKITKEVVNNTPDQRNHYSGIQRLLQTLLSRREFNKRSTVAAIGIASGSLPDLHLHQRRDDVETTEFEYGDESDLYHNPWKWITEAKRRLQYQKDTNGLVLTEIQQQFLDEMTEGSQGHRVFTEVFPRYADRITTLAQNMIDHNWYEYFPDIQSKPFQAYYRLWRPLTVLRWSFPNPNFSTGDDEDVINIYQTSDRDVYGGILEMVRWMTPLIDASDEYIEQQELYVGQTGERVNTDRLLATIANEPIEDDPGLEVVVRQVLEQILAVIENSMPGLLTTVTGIDLEDDAHRSHIDGSVITLAKPFLDFCRLVRDGYSISGDPVTNKWVVTYAIDTLLHELIHPRDAHVDRMGQHAERFQQIHPENDLRIVELQAELTTQYIDLIRNGTIEGEEGTYALSEDSLTELFYAQNIPTSGHDEVTTTQEGEYNSLDVFAVYDEFRRMEEHLRTVELLLSWMEQNHPDIRVVSRLGLSRLFNTQATDVLPMWKFAGEENAPFLGLGQVNGKGFDSNINGDRFHAPTHFSADHIAELKQFFLAVTGYSISDSGELIPDNRIDFHENEQIIQADTLRMIVRIKTHYQFLMWNIMSRFSTLISEDSNNLQRDPQNESIISMFQACDSEQGTQSMYFLTYLAEYQAMVLGKYAHCLVGPIREYTPEGAQLNEGVDPYAPWDQQLLEMKANYQRLKEQQLSWLSQLNVIQTSDPIVERIRDLYWDGQHRIFDAKMVSFGYDLYQHNNTYLPSQPPVDQLCRIYSQVDTLFVGNVRG